MRSLNDLKTPPLKISPNPSFSKREISSFVKGGEVGFNTDRFVKSLIMLNSVIPAKAEIQTYFEILDSGSRFAYPE